jgi:DNA-binding CsgD family transcriptional regulator
VTATATLEAARGPLGRALTPGASEYQNDAVRPPAAPAARFPRPSRPEPATRIAPAASRSLLTATQLRVLDHLADGYTRAQTAARMYISPNTVMAHLSRASRKIGYSTQAGMVGYAYRTGLLRRAAGPVVKLTARRTQVVWLVANGASNQAIADELSVDIETVKTLVRFAMRDLGARSRPHLVRCAVDAGALPPAWWGGAR